MGGVYTDNVSEAELSAYMEGIAESIPKDAPESDFAAPPKGLYVGDAKHARLAVQAVSSTGLMGNRAKKDKAGAPGAKSKIAAAVRKFYKGEEQKYYLSWLRTGKMPKKKPASEIRISEMQIPAPVYNYEDELRFPDIPIAPGVNLEKLTEGDPDPLFVTRPLAILGEVSENGLPYTKLVCDAIYNQVGSGKVVAGRGHIREEERSSAFPPDEGYWVGTVWDNAFYNKPAVFGKVYIPPDSSMYKTAKRRKATGAGISNSIWGTVSWNNDEPADVQIERVDFVPPERASLQATGGDFKVTSEMKEASMSDHDEDDAAEMSLKEMVAKSKPEDLHEALRECGSMHKLAEMHLKAGGCAECTTATMSEMLGEARRGIAESFLKEQVTPENTYEMLSPAQRKGVAEAYCKETNQKMTSEQENNQETAIAEMKTRLSEMDTLKSQLAEMTTRTAEMEKAIKAYQRADFERALDATIETYFDVQVRTDNGKAAIANLKSRLRKDSLVEMAGMEGGQVEANIKAACDKAWAENKPLVEMAYAGLQGPNVVIAPPKDGGNRKDFRTGIDQSTGFFSPEFMKTAKAASAGAPRRKGGK